MARRSREPFTIAGHAVAAGHRAQIELPIARLMSGTPVALPVIVLHGRTDGPTVWINAALHGDELCGVEIVRRVLAEVSPRTIAGTLIAVPIVNVHGFNAGSRYLPDRRDLNRSFPGSARGSLASRIAHLMMTEVVDRCEVGIDLHTASDHRTNLPQVRADLDDPDTLELARVFGAPLTLHSQTRDGSLRQAATEAGATVLLYEGGEANRFDRAPIVFGTAGVLRVLAELGMITGVDPGPRSTACSRASRWVRASTSGILHLEVDLGSEIAERDLVATIYDPFGKRLGRLRSPTSGVVIGHTQHPLVNRGDAVAHIAVLDDPLVA
mgnify:CR=1 FL=1